MNIPIPYNIQKGDTFAFTVGVEYESFIDVVQADYTSPEYFKAYPQLSDIGGLEIIEPPHIGADDLEALLQTFNNTFSFKGR